MISVEYPQFVQTTAALIEMSRRYLSVTPNIMSAVDYFKGNTRDLLLRVWEFDEVCDAITSARFEIADARFGRRSTAYNRDNFNNLVNLIKSLTEDQPFVHDLRDMFLITADPRPDYFIYRKRVVETYRQINTLIVAGRNSEGGWSFPNGIEDPFVLASGLLIEGYGLFLQNLYSSVPELDRNFVLGFEELLWNKFSNFRLLKDVLPWMTEDRDYFGSKMKPALAKLAK